MRLYPIPHPSGDGFLAVPGVTSILSCEDSSEDRQRLENWRQRQLAEGKDPNAARDRGSRVHELLEQWIRTGNYEPKSEEDERFFSGMTSHLTPYEEFLWSERPLRKGWEHCWNLPEGHSKRLARVWSTVWGFAGTPDLIARREAGLVVLGDFKTSNQPYYRCHGRKVPQHKATGYRKFMKTVRQLAAYRIAIKETLGIEVNALQIIVGLPEQDAAQSFCIQDGPFLEAETERFKQASVRFWQQYQPAAPRDA